MELFSLDPIWASLCTGFVEDRLDGPSILLFDPPIALTLGAGLVSFITPTSLPAPNNAHPTTVPEKKTASSTPAAKPANSPTGSVDPPVRTADPPARTADPPTKTVDPPLRTIDPPSRTADAGRDPMAPPSKAGDPATLANQGDPPPPGNVNPASDPVDPPSGQDSPVARKSDITQTASTDLNAPSWSTLRHGDGLRSPTPELGALIYYAFEKSGPETVEAANQKWILTSDAQDISIGTDQILSIDPSEVKFQGKVYSIGGSGITLSNSAHTVVPEKSKIHTGSVDQSLGDALPPPTAPITLTIAAVGTIIPNPKGLILNSATISPGGSAHTFDDGTKMIMISVDPSGNLIVASSTIPLLASHTRLITSLLTPTNGLTIKEDESSHHYDIVDGVRTTTRLGAASGVTIDGSVITSLLENGTSTLDVVGTGSLVIMPTGVRNASGGVVIFESSTQGRGLGLSCLHLLSGVGGALIALTI